MGKFIGFMLLWRLVGNPIIAILILVAVIYFLDRRYVGVFPSLTKPFKRMKKISKLRSQILMNPNDVSSKHELACLLIERKKYQEAFEILSSIQVQFEHSAEYWDDLGTANLMLGHIEDGEGYILKALSINPRVKYGQPYLRLASIYQRSDHGRVEKYVRQYQDIHSSSCEACYLLGMMYKEMGLKEEAQTAFSDSIDIYRSLPKYKKRQERKWAVLSIVKRMG
ncbi:tetratricopeptide repeat protein [Paenibacillus sp. FA6]|uniref:tetratricopeptide repeat protein n=1 Tax=Paenibacillus sp. FA6 TaxID=3413029 RepID=UPI003F658E81